jgi:hypothetical protein
MTGRRFCASIAVVLVATAVSTSGALAVAEGTPAGGSAATPGVHEQAFEQAMDSRGRPLGPPVEVSAAAHRPDAAAHVAASAPPRGGSPLTATGGRRLQASGCKTVWVRRYQTGYFGETLWKYQQDKYFCWSSPRVTNVQTSAYGCCTDPFWRWVGNVGSAGWFFAWSGNSRGGHYSYRQGRFNQVVLGTVTTSSYPWTKIWVYGNGNWSYETDVSS